MLAGELSTNMSVTVSSFVGVLSPNYVSVNCLVCELSRSPCHCVTLNCCTHILYLNHLFTKYLHNILQICHVILSFTIISTYRCSILYLHFVIYHFCAFCG